MRRLLVNLLLLAVSTVLGLAGTEAALRLVPNRWAQAQRADAAAPVHKPMRDLGGGLYTGEPDSEAEHRGPCYHITGIRTNALGFRDRDHAVAKRDRRILVLGDSVAEGRHVGNGETVAAQLERLTGTETMAVATEGWSTVTELAAFRRFGAPFHPDVVALFFYLGNDVSGNSCPLAEGPALCGRLVEGRPVLTPAAASSSPAPAAAQAVPAPVPARERDGALRRWARDHLVLYQALHDLRVAALGLVNQAHGAVPERWRIYLADQPPEWRDAWTLTEATLAELRDAVAAGGGRLVVVSIPEQLAVDPDWRRTAMLSGGSAVPADFDPSRPSRRLAGIAERLGLPVLDLLPRFAAYRDHHGLAFPYFGFACDGHWSPLGHFVAAHELAVFLGLESPAAHDAALARPPHEVLGERAWQAIFHGGVYRGGAATGAAP
jgi:hypothetical protein